MPKKDEPIAPHMGKFDLSLWVLVGRAMVHCSCSAAACCNKIGNLFFIFIFIFVLAMGKERKILLPAKVFVCVCWLLLLAT